MNSLPFNSAVPQVETSQPESTLREDLIREYLNNRIKAALKEHLSKLFPEASQEKDMVYIGLVRVDLISQYWTVGLAQEFRFKTLADKLSGSSCTYSAPNSCFVSLYAKVYGLPVQQALREICGKLGPSFTDEHWYEQTGLPGCTEEYSVSATETVDAVADHPVFVQHSYKRTADVVYKNPAGTVHCVTRIYSSGNQNLHTVLTPYRSPDAGLIWAYGYPSLPCLYGLDGISASAPGGSVLITPDESAMLHLERNYKGIITPAFVTTWTGGQSHGIDKLNFSCLADKTVIIFPECSKKGFTKAGRLAEALSKNSICGIRVVGRKRTFEAIQSDQGVEKALATDLFQAFILGELQTLDEFYRDAEEFFGLELLPQSSLSQPVSWSELQKSPDTEAEWLIENLIRKGARVLLYAAKGSGKTWMNMLICIFVLAGSSSLGGKAGKRRPLKILLVDGENPVSDLVGRFKLLLKAFGLPESIMDAIDFYSAQHLGQKIELDDPDVREALKPRIDAADVVIIDNVNCTWQSAMSGLPEASTDLNAFINELGIMGKTIILVTHTTKDGRTSFGSSTKEFGMDVRISLKSDERTKGFGFKATVKSRSDEPVKPFNISLGKDDSGKFCVQIEGGQHEVEHIKFDDKLDVIDIPASVAARQDMAYLASGPVSGAESDITDSVSVPTATTPDVSDVAHTRPDNTMPPLKPNEAFYLVLYNQGHTSDRGIEKASKAAVAEGVEGAVLIPKGTAGNIKKRLKRRGLIPSE